MHTNKLGGGVQALLYTMVHHERLITVEEIARAVGCEPPTIYEYLNAKPIIPVAVLKAVFERTADPRLKRALEPAGWRLVPDDQVVETAHDIEADLGDVHIAAGALHQAVREARAANSDGGGEITIRELDGLEKQANEVERQLADVRAHLKELRAETESRQTARLAVPGKQAVASIRGVD
ncbi:MAG: hypothetical protein C4575_09495 [Desulforudis sp.]|nr:MAG: hypothetical protein C4575_09495 [Desulforudis sp.]